MIIKTWPYRGWRTSANLENFLEEKLGISDKWSERIAVPYSVLCEIINYIESKVTPDPSKPIVRIARYDTWSMDTTLSNIIVPMLIQLKETKHGAPFVDDEDVPEHLRSDKALPKENKWDTDSNHFLRWDWVLDEMIYCFTEIRDQTVEDKIYNGSMDSSDRYEALKNNADRIQNGTILFGKYYRSLWD